MPVVLGSSLPPTLHAFVDIARGLSDFSDFRLQSTFSHPNIYAFYLVLLLGLALYVRASRVVDVSQRIRLLVALYIPLLAVFLLLTKTRSAWGACGVMFLVYAISIEPLNSVAKRCRFEPDPAGTTAEHPAFAL
uniref:Uncharacterized protein n=1 Tax=Bosea sp. NBC_00436 TaxID=2969620 RepID=A0A9E8CPF9_9HYPH